MGKIVRNEVFLNTKQQHPLVSLKIYYYNMPNLKKSNSIKVIRILNVKCTLY